MHHREIPNYVDPLSFSRRCLGTNFKSHAVFRLLIGIECHSDLHYLMSSVHSISKNIKIKLLDGCF